MKRNIERKVTMNFKMLVVDDEDDSRELITMYAGPCHFDTLEADSLANAIKILQGEEEIQALFVDQNLPDGKGTDLIKMANDLNKGILSIIYSGNDPNDLLDLATELEAYDIIGKPCPSKYIKLKFKNLYKLIAAQNKS